MSIGLELGQRGVCIGQTGCGKSTLATDLLRRFLNDYPTGRILIVDSKPRYRATHRVNGLPINYKKWAKGDTIEGSVAIHSSSQLAQAFKFTRCAVLQSMHPDGREVDDFEEQVYLAARRLFVSSHVKQPTLFYVDEYYDILRGGLAAFADRRILRVLRAGRERFMAALLCTQRPKSIPLPTLTEADKYYIFNLEYADDVKYLRQHGPKLTVGPTGHNFVFYERLRGGARIEKLMRLQLEQKAAA